MTSAFEAWWRAAVLAAAALALAVPAGATGPGKGRPPGQPRVGGPSPRIGAPSAMLRNPAGPTPLNPAGPTPLNPAGPPPLNPTGLNVPVPRTVVVGPRRGVHVGIVGGGFDSGVPLGGSFFCEVHNRGYATQSLFFNHLATADGVAGEEALAYLIEDGGVWIFPAN